MKRLGIVVSLALLIIVVALGLWLRFSQTVPHPEAANTVAPSVPPATLAANPGAGVPETPSAPLPELSFVRVDVETAQPTAEACLVFSHALDAGPSVHYDDYLVFAPALRPALRVDGQRLCASGLAFGVAYETELRQGLPAQDGFTLLASKKVTVELRDRPPLLAFRDGLILPRENAAGVPITSINIDSVALKVIRVPDRLISQIRRETIEEKESYFYELNQLEREQGALIWQGEMAVQAHRNETATTLFPLRQVLTDKKPGVYVLVAEDAAQQKKNSGAEDFDYRPKAVQWVIDSNIGLTSFAAADGLHVFARAFDGATPLRDLSVTLVARDNEVLATGKTDEEGHLRFDPGLLRGKGGTAPDALMAYGADGDFTFQDLTRPAFDLSDRGVDGREAPGPVDAFLYTDRGIYRPKETVEIVTLIRDPNADAIAKTPVTLIVKRPDGATYRSVTLQDQAVGAAQYALALTDTAPHGHWHVEAYLDTKGKPVGQAEFEVQDFVPQRLKVELTTAATVLRPGEAVHLDAEARFLYGAPANDLEGEADATIAADPAPFPAYRGYRFGLAQESFKEKIIPLTVAQTDAQGKTAVTGTLSDIGDTSQPLRAQIRVAIFEPGGRSTENNLSLPLRTRPLAIGIHPLFAGDRIQENSDAGFEILALDENGQAVAQDHLDYQLVKEITEYTWYKTERGFHYDHATHDVPVVDGTIDVSAKTPAAFHRTLPWGYYRLTVRDPASGAATSIRFSAGWSGVLAEDRPDKAEVSADKDRYIIGETAHIAIRPPTKGKALLVLANDHILATRTIDVAAEGTTIDVPVSADWGTGVYAIVTSYRPLGDGNERAPVRAIGLRWLPVDAKARTLTVDVGSPDRVRPRQTLSVPIHVQGGENGQKTFVTLAAVDEGILQLTKFVTPSPNDYYFGKRRLAVEMRDDYGRLIDAKGSIGTLRAGGDAGGSRALEVVPTRTVALFSGIVTLDASGHADLPLDIPDFNGELRLMAVAFDAHKVGMAEAHLVVRDAVVSDVTLPRFLAPGDHSRLSLDLHNLEGAAGAYRARFEASGAAGFPDAAEREVTLEAGQRQLLAFALDGKEAGIGTIALHLTGPDHFAVDRSWQIAVRQPRLPVTQEVTNVIAPGQSAVLDPHLLDSLVPGTGSVTVGLDTVRTVPIAGLLRALDRYPFGCVEQLTSRAFPLLYFNDLAPLMGTTQDQGAEARVQAAIDRLLDMQRIDGNFGLWSVAGEQAHDWLSVYALDFLTEAAGKNYAVPPQALDHGQVWLRRLVQNNRTLTRIRYYAAYVLTKQHAMSLPDLRYMFDTVNRKDPPTAFAEAQLGAALALAGDRARAQAAFDKAEAMPLAPRNVPLWGNYNDGDYYASALRDWAGLVTMAAEAGQINLMARLLDRYQWVDEDVEALTTQEKAWLLLATQALTQRRGNLAVTVDGTKMTGQGKALNLTPDAAVIARGYAIGNQSDHEVWETVSVQGVPKDPLMAAAKDITLDRVFWTLDGKPADLAAVHQNDRLIVALSGATADARHHEIALLDLLPAGFEIEGVVKADEKGNSPYPFLNTLRPMRLTDARDDRFLASFVVHPDRYEDREVNLQEEKSGYLVAYVVRAITPGTYVLPATGAQDMYRPAIKANNAMGTVTILPRS